eukprot:CFRG2537T1
MPWHGDNSTGHNSTTTKRILNLRIANLQVAKTSCSHVPEAKNNTETSKKTYNLPPRVYINPTTNGCEDLYDKTKSPLDVLLFAHVNPQALVPVAWDFSVVPGTIALSEVQRLNFEVCEGSVEQWRVYDSSSKPLRTLCELLVEVRRRWPTDGGHVKASMNVDTASKTISKMLWQSPVSLYEKHLLTVENDEFVTRIIDMIPETGEDDDDDCVVIDTFHAIVDDTTHIVFVEDKDLTLTHTTHNARLTSGANGPDPSIVDITTEDDEWFPVKKRLLLPCIALAAVCISEGHQTATVDIRSDIFDRVLLFLEAERKANPNENVAYELDSDYTQDLLVAAEKLGCQGLVQRCKEKLGEFVTRVRVNGVSFEEIVQRNTKGETILIIDGMVFDVTRWLVYHPGGSTIIPNQALNIDSVGFFELYHSSRASFRFLRQFYIGDVTNPEKVPKQDHVASEAFIDQLRSYTAWRVIPLEPAYKSF